MALGRPDNNNETRDLIVIVYYYRDMWPMQSHTWEPLTETTIGPKGRKILWNEALESYFKEIQRIVSS